MPTLSFARSIEINAPVEQVFALIADPCRRMSAMSRVHKRRIAVSDVVASPDGVIRRYKITTRFFWLPLSTTIAGIRAEHVPNERIVDKTLVRTKDVDDFTLEPAGNGTADLALRDHHSARSREDLGAPHRQGSEAGAPVGRALGPVQAGARDRTRIGTSRQAIDEAASDKRTRKLIRRFDKALQERLLVERYGEVTAGVVRLEVREEGRVIPQLPDIGGRDNSDTGLLEWGAGRWRSTGSSSGTEGT